MLNLHNVEVRVVMEFDNIETIKRAIEIDAGVGLLPEPTVRREVDAGTWSIVPLAGIDLVRPLGILYRRGKDLGVTVRRFMELLSSNGHKSMTEELHDPLEVHGAASEETGDSSPVEPTRHFRVEPHPERVAFAIREIKQSSGLNAYD